ncbi:MAG: alpha/beta fold hydrolase [Rhodospirillaceae bacterium]|nr:alpha/beta fold hydrolase [Rhodospirillaceae bacterium]
MTGLRNGWPGWNGPEAERLRSRFAHHDDSAVAAAVGRASAEAFSGFLAGIAAYRNHPYRRAVPEPPVVASYGTARLLDYSARGRTAGPPFLLVPSLVNRGYVLDLMPGVSLARFLSENGAPVYLLEWNAPDAEESGFDLSRLIGERLLPALDDVIERAGRPALIGYCMGGLLVLGAARRRMVDLAGLAVLATPWDFHAERPEQARALAHFAGSWLPVLEALGQFPVDGLQALFAANDPMVAFRKFRAFARMDPDSDAARRFVALEDWLNDGIPLPLPIARQTLQEWYGENLTAAGRWTVDGRTIRPEEIDLPTLALIPDKDRIVPQESALALARLLPQAEIRIARAGHIGMMAGRRAERETWRPLLAWQQSLAA